MTTTQTLTVWKNVPKYSSVGYAPFLFLFSLINF
jgi:hypothetical protein